jgi:hypothetical protein
MTMAVESATRQGRLPWIFAPWFLPIWYPSLGFLWWKVFATEAARSDLAARPLVPSIMLAASLAAAGKFMGFVIEAGFFHFLWKSRGRRLPFWRFFCVVASLSMADLLASALGELPHGQSGQVSGWLWPMAGLHLLSGTPFAEPGALRAAFGTVGLLTGFRIVMTAHAQSRALDLALGKSLAVTAGAWLATRMAILWSVDLMKGMSPLGS